jgi:hypothetical protein
MIRLAVLLGLAVMLAGCGGGLSTQPTTTPATTPATASSKAVVGSETTADPYAGAPAGFDLPPAPPSPPPGGYPRPR